MSQLGIMGFTFLSTIEICDDDDDDDYYYLCIKDSAY